MQTRKSYVHNTKKNIWKRHTSTQSTNRQEIIILNSTANSYIILELMIYIFHIKVFVRMCRTRHVSGMGMEQCSWEGTWNICAKQLDDNIMLWGIYGSSIPKNILNIVFTVPNWHAFIYYIDIHIPVSVNINPAVRTLIKQLSANKTHKHTTLNTAMLSWMYQSSNRTRTRFIHNIYETFAIYFSVGMTKTKQYEGYVGAKAFCMLSIR